MNRSQMVRASVLAILTDTAPRPWRTVELQEAHSWRDRQRTYNALRSLVEVHRLVRLDRTLDCCWWWADDDRAVCWRCGLQAARVQRRPIGHWADRLYVQTGWHGGLVCREPRCSAARANLAGAPWPDWPWPT